MTIKNRFSAAILGVLACWALVSPLPGLADTDENPRLGPPELMPVRRTFIPADGYDDNDTIELVSEGVFPNWCWLLTEKTIERTTEANTYRVKIMASRALTKDCAVPDEQLSEKLKSPKPYTLTLTVGENVAAGQYRVLSPSSTGTDHERIFRVQVAKSTAVDDFRYAPVSSALVPDSVKLGTPPTITLTGEIHSDCYVLSAEPEIELHEDVIVVLPILKENNEPCTGAPESYVQAFTIPFELKRGRYLVHIRKENSSSFNIPFSVK